MLPSWAKIVVAAGLLLCSMVSASRAENATSAVPIVGVYADGARGPQLRTELLQALPSHMAVSTTDLRQAFRDAGIRDLRSAMSTAAGRMRLGRTVQSVLSSAGLYAVVIAHPDRTKQPGAHARLLVVVGGEATARLDERVDIPARSSPAQRRARWKAALSSALKPPLPPDAPEAPETPGSSDAPESPEPSPARTQATTGIVAATQPPSLPPHASPPQASPPRTPSAASSQPGRAAESGTAQPISTAPADAAGASWLECGADRLWAYRNYSHTESTLQRSTRRYVGSGLAGQAVTVDIRPFRGQPGAFLRRLSVSLQGFTMGSFPSSGPGSYPLDDAPTPVPTSWYGASAGLRWNIFSEPLVFGVGVGYGVSIYDLNMPEDGREIPRGRYGMARIAADTRIPLGGPWALTLSAAYLHVISIASVVAYAPTTSSNGIVPAGVGLESTLALTMTALPSLDLRLGGQYDGVFYKADRTVEPTGNPGSVRDQYLWLAVGARLRL